jgi:hypothetical protein
MKISELFPTRFGGKGVWEGKLWEMLAETTMFLADRVSMSNGAVEPFVDGSDLSLTNAVVESGYCRSGFSVGGIVTPVMLSESQGGYQLFADGVLGGGFPISGAFNQQSSSGDGYGMWISPPGVYPHYVGVSLPVGVSVSCYGVHSRNYATDIAYPSSWQFQGSNDGIVWVTLDERVGQSFSADQGKIFYLDFPSEVYSYYRLNCLSGVTSYVAIEEFAIYAAVRPGVTVGLNPVGVSGAVFGKIVFRAQRMGASGVLDVGSTGSNLLEVYPVRSGVVGSALSFTSESLGGNIYRYTSEEFSLSGASSLGVRFQSFARSVAPNFRIYDCYFLWR